jgi:SHS2 domain-containing protein
VSPVRYRHPQPHRDLEHTADVGVEVRGASREEALARLVLAEAALLAGGGPVAAEREERLRAPPGGPGEAALWFLRELLFRFATERLLVAGCEVLSLDPAAGAELVLELGRFDPARHGEGLDLKAVTRHQPAFGPEGGEWRARVFFDI